MRLAPLVLILLLSLGASANTSSRLFTDAGRVNEMSPVERARVAASAKQRLLRVSWVIQRSSN